VDGSWASMYQRQHLDYHTMHAGLHAILNTEGRGIIVGGVQATACFALKVRSLLLPGFQDPYESVLLHVPCVVAHAGDTYSRLSFSP
jgi:hypothetical protein